MREQAMSARVAPQRRPRMPRPMMILARERQLGQRVSTELRAKRRIGGSPVCRT
jgi:hypothetical protein